MVVSIHGQGLVCITNEKAIENFKEIGFRRAVRKNEGHAIVYGGHIGRRT